MRQMVKGEGRTGRWVLGSWMIYGQSLLRSGSFFFASSICINLYIAISTGAKIEIFSLGLTFPERKGMKNCVYNIIFALS